MLQKRQNEHYSTISDFSQKRLIQFGFQDFLILLTFVRPQSSWQTDIQNHTSSTMLNSGYQMLLYIFPISTQTHLKFLLLTIYCICYISTSAIFNPNNSKHCHFVYYYRLRNFKLKREMPLSVMIYNCFSVLF